MANWRVQVIVEDADDSYTRIVDTLRYCRSLEEVEVEIEDACDTVRELIDAEEEAFEDDEEDVG